MSFELEHDNSTITSDMYAVLHSFSVLYLIISIVILKRDDVIKNLEI